MSALAAEQRGRLVGAKLAALVAHRTGERPEPVVLPGAAAALGAGSAWVLLDEQPETSLGVALAWAQRHEAPQLDVVVDTGEGTLARQATAFTFPTRVWRVEGHDLVAASPAPTPLRVEPSAAELAAAAVLVEAGADIIIEHGVVRGEIAGLEIARVVTVDGVATVQPGVGRNDREGHRFVAGTGTTDPASLRAIIDRVIAEVARHRQGDAADRHPLGRMARGRWLRRVVTADPALVGAARLEPAEPTVERHTVADGAAFASGELADGTPVVVGCAGGIDLGLVPEAADVRLGVAEGVGAVPQLVLAAAARDLHPVVRRMADAVAGPVEIVALPDDWHRRPPVR